MLSLDELKKVMELKRALSIPLDEGSCFGVTDPKRLRPPFNLKKATTSDKKEKEQE